MSADHGERFYNKIFFCDVIGYSKLDPPGQFACQRTLNCVVTDVLSSLGCKLEEDVIALPTGDGLILNFLAPAPDIHLRTAMLSLEGLHAQASETLIGLRIGLNSFVDTWVRDINGKKNVVGSGINMAQRVMDLGRHGQILMHDRVRIDLANYADYADHLTYRGTFRVKHGVEVPVAQYVDPACDWITNDPAQPPPQPPAVVTAALYLDELLEKRVQGNVLTLKLDRRARDNISLIQDYAEACLDEIGVLQRLKMAAGWVVGELVQNIFQHGPKDRPVAAFELKLDRTRQGLLISVLQNDWAPFELAEVLGRTGRNSFMQMMANRGLRWHERMIGERRELGLELPADLDLRPRWAAAIEPKESGSRAAISTPTVLAAVPFGRIDHSNCVAFSGWLQDAVRVARSDDAVLVLDLSAMDYIASLGLAEMMSAKREGGVDTPIVLAAASPRVGELLALSRFDKVFNLYASVGDALAAFGSQPARTIG